MKMLQSTLKVILLIQALYRALKVAEWSLARQADPDKRSKIANHDWRYSSQAREFVVDSTAVLYGFICRHAYRLQVFATRVPC